jgi:hypothetical protein
MISRDLLYLRVRFQSFCIYNAVTKRFMFVSVRVEFYIGARARIVFPKAASPTGGQGHHIQCRIPEVMGLILASNQLYKKFDRSYRRGLSTASHKLHRSTSLVQSKVSLDFTTLCLQCNLEQLVLVEDIHALRNESKVSSSTRNCKDTKQNTFRIPARILRSALL